MMEEASRLRYKSLLCFLFALSWRIFHVCHRSDLKRESDFRSFSLPVLAIHLESNNRANKHSTMDVLVSVSFRVTSLSPPLWVIGQGKFSDVLQKEMDKMIPKRIVKLSKRGTRQSLNIPWFRGCALQHQCWASQQIYPEGTQWQHLCYKAYKNTITILSGLNVHILAL